MTRFSALPRFLAAGLAMAGFVWLGAIKADVDPKVAALATLSTLKWVENPNGVSASVVLTGDPAKEGQYVQFLKWHPRHNSLPHMHQNDRFITVLSGTWWVGTGTHYDMESTVPVKAGSVIVHYGKQWHYDGAKDEECVLEIVGMGPATSILFDKNAPQYH